MYVRMTYGDVNGIDGFQRKKDRWPLYPSLSKYKAYFLKDCDFPKTSGGGLQNKVGNKKPATQGPSF